MEQGTEVHALARQFFGDGLYVGAVEDARPEEVTRRLIEGGADMLFEATFVRELFIARADVIKRDGSGWRVFEVKSSFSDTNNLADYTEDLAYPVLIAREAGLSVCGASLVLLDREYRYGDEPASLFRCVDQTAAVEECLIGGTGTLADARVIVEEQCPTPTLLSGCRHCEFFETECLGKGVAHSVLELPRLHASKLKELSVAGIVSLRDLPPGLSLTDTQARVRDAVIDGKPYIDRGLGAELATVVWPCHYLDFETVATTLPLYPDRGCHEQVLTQFSLHHCDTPGHVTGHDEYLADAGADHERDVADALIAACERPGSIMAYSSFEKARITSLAARFPELSAPLTGILDRLVDLHAIVSRCVYDPKFGGSFSIKRVLPALVPDLSYSGLEIADGDAAIMHFARMARGELDEDAVARTREALLVYCGRDTEAMVRLHEALVRLALGMSGGT